MIRYPYPGAGLEVAVETERPGWLARAATRRANMLNAQAFDDGDIWSEVKPVFMEIQAHKCVYCERKRSDKLEVDLEHFRPKNAVVEWTAGPTPDTPPATIPAGYYWLAYDVFNYAASCKQCNTDNKASFFPVSGARGVAGDEVTALYAENPVLCFPLGDEDDDPEDLIGFVATIAVPAAGTVGRQRARAEAIIQFFNLNGRDPLQYGRAMQIVLLKPYLEKRSAGVDEPEDREVIQMMLCGWAEHTACCRAFERLWVQNQVEATNVWRECSRVIAGAAANWIASQ